MTEQLIRRRAHMSMDLKVTVRRLYEEIWNKRKLELMDVLLSPSHALHGSTFSGRSIGPEAYRSQILLYTGAFPDLRFTIEDMIAEKEKVVTYWTMSGTHKGEFRGIPPTNKKISLDGITIHYITDGKIMDSYVSLDMWGMMQQLGLAPPIGQPQKASAR
jgi:steroid delta-isomerase-like uncharacterized protein